MYYKSLRGDRYARICARAERKNKKECKNDVTDTSGIEFTTSRVRGVRAVSAVPISSRNGPIYRVLTPKLLNIGGQAQETETSRQLLQDLLQEVQLINNVSELRVQPQLVRYYHATAGFSTQCTWLKAIANGHYQSWVGLIEAVVQRISQSRQRHEKDMALN